MANWFVRPSASHGGANTGVDYANAWQGWTAIVWGASGVKGGDTLYVCGNHAKTAKVEIGAHGGTISSAVAIRGDFTVDPGSFTFTSFAFLEVATAWTTISNFTITTSVTTEHNIYAKADGVKVQNCTLTGGVEGVHLLNTVVPSVFEVSGCTISGVSAGGVGFEPTTGSAAMTGIVIANNTIHTSGFYGIYVRVAGAAGTTSNLNNVKIRDNHIYNCQGASILFGGTTVDPGIPSIYALGLEITGNNVHDCGRTAGDLGAHGGIGVTGASMPLIYGNTVANVYVTGAGIQTQRNKDIIICFNTVSGVRSGTPTSQFQGGLPIDGNGIFFDNDTNGGVAFGNHVSDLVTTGFAASGCALAIWDCDNVSYYGNIAENCAVGACYGKNTESGNSIYNNTFINCTEGIRKAASAVISTITIKNNIILNCTTGMHADAFPSADNDYNCIYGSTIVYSGFTAGANDITTNPDLDAEFRPRAAACKRTGAALVGKDYYGKHFYSPPNRGAVDDITLTPRYILKP